MVTQVCPVFQVFIVLSDEDQTYRESSLLVWKKNLACVASEELNSLMGNMQKPELQLSAKCQGAVGDVGAGLPHRVGRFRGGNCNCS